MRKQKKVMGGLLGALLIGITLFYFLSHATTLEEALSSGNGNRKIQVYHTFQDASGLHVVLYSQFSGEDLSVATVKRNLWGGHKVKDSSCIGEVKRSLQKKGYLLASTRGLKGLSQGFFFGILDKTRVFALRLKEEKKEEQAASLYPIEREEEQLFVFGGSKASDSDQIIEITAVDPNKNILSTQTWRFQEDGTTGATPVAP